MNGIVGKAFILTALLCWTATVFHAAALEQPEATMVITDRFGEPLRAYSGESGSCMPLKFSEISPWLPLATLAAEDKRFYSHFGVDLRAAARAFIQNWKSGRTISGASTITQQLVRSLEPRQPGLWGKILEMFSAVRIEVAHSKEEILESYFNRVPYGPMITGAGAAAAEYFGLPAANLSPAQAALLAGIPKSPVNYDPRRRPGAAFRRQRSVLRRMSELGLIDEETHRLALGEKITIKEKRGFFSAPHFADMAAKRGVKLTTLDSRVQEAAARALSGQLTTLKGRNHITNGAVLVLENATGGVLAWVGSNDFFDEINSGQVDGVTALRQPGSALKPFLYALALSNGARASDLLDDSPIYSPGAHSPTNYDRTYHGSVRLREALACSYNIPAIRVAQKVGVEALLSKLHDFGFDSLKRQSEFYGEGLALGNGEVTLLELGNAYATLARGGIWLPVRVGPPEKAPARRAIGRGEAYIISDILSDNSARTPAFGASSAFNLPFALAAKTGTTKDYRDNWAVGYTPEWTIAVWVGNFNGKPMRRVSGITGAAPVLKEIALEMNKLYEPTRFRRPPGVRTAKVCPSSGLPVSPFCSSAIEELYLPGDTLAGQCHEHDPHPEPEAPVAPVAVKFPKDGDVFKIDPHTPSASQAIFFEASSEVEASWILDGKELTARGQSVSWPLSPGRHSLFFTIIEGNMALKSERIFFEVIN